MFHRSIQVAIRDFLLPVRHPAAIVWAFVMAAVFFPFIDKMTSGFEPRLDRPGIIAVLAALALGAGRVASRSFRSR